MLVRNTLDACECEVCGTACTGRFANCWRSIFQENGRVVQMRCLPPTIPQPASAEIEIAPETEPLIPATGDHATSSEDMDAQYGASDIELQVADLQEKISEILASLQDQNLSTGQLKGEIAALSERLDAMAVRPVVPVSPLVPPVTPVLRPSESTPADDFERPGRAVVHADVVHRQRGSNRLRATTDSNDELTPPLAEGTGGGIG